MITLGQKVRDKVSGVTGIAIGRTEWLTGCNTIVIQPPMKADDTTKKPESISADEPWCEVLDATPLEPPTVKTASTKPGGPRDLPSSNKDVSRR
jgi:hypothetical protein